MKVKKRPRKAPPIAPKSVTIRASANRDGLAAVTILLAVALPLLLPLVLALKGHHEPATRIALALLEGIVRILSALPR